MRIIPLAGALQCSYTIEHAKCDRDFRNWLAGTGLYARRSESGRQVWVERVGKSSADHGIFARHLVTELRETYGSV